MVNCYETRTFELSIRSLMTWTPQKIKMIEHTLRIIPTAITCVMIEDPIWGIKFVIRMSEATNHHNRYSCCPGYPSKSTRESQKKIRMLHERNTFRQWYSTSKILGTVWDVVPMQSMAPGRIFVDAKDPITAIFQPANDVSPTVGIVPIFT